MKDRPSNRAVARALAALEAAILADAAASYPRLLAEAFAAGATDADVDVAVHRAVRELFLSAELPVTPRRLAQQHARPVPCPA